MYRRLNDKMCVETSSRVYAKAYFGLRRTKATRVLFFFQLLLVPDENITFSNKFSSTHFFAGVEWGTVRVKFPSQELNTMFSATAQHLDHSIRILVLGLCASARMVKWKMTITDFFS